MFGKYARHIHIHGTREQMYLIDQISTSASVLRYKPRYYGGGSEDVSEISNDDEADPPVDHPVTWPQTSDNEIDLADLENDGTPDHSSLGNPV